MVQTGLEKMLADYYFFYFMVLFVVFIFLLVINRQILAQKLKRIRKKYLLILLIIVLISVFFRFFFVSHIYQVYDDEYVFIDVAKSFSFEQGFFLCKSRLDFNCANPSYNPWPPGMPFIYHLVFSTFGLDHNFIFFFNSVLGVLTVMLAFFAVFLFFKRELPALFVAMVLAVHPIHMKISGSSAIGVGSLFFLLLVLYIFFIYSENQTWRTGLLLLFSLLVFSNMRLENFFIFAFIIPFYFNNLKRNWRIFVLLALYLLLMLPFILNVAEGFNHAVPNWSSSPADHFDSLKLYIMPNTLFLLKDYSNLFLVTLLFAVGLVLSFRDKKLIPMICWLFFVFVFVTSYSAGNFSSGANYRYVLILIVPMLFLAARGLEYLLSKISSRQTKIVVLLFAVVLVIWPFFHSDFLFFQRDWHEKYLIYNNISHSFDKDCLLFKYYRTVYDNPLILGSMSNRLSFDPMTFQDEDLSLINRFECKKFLIETSDESVVQEETTIILGKNYLDGHLESTHKLSDNFFISVYNMSRETRPVK